MQRVNKQSALNKEYKVKYKKEDLIELEKAEYDYINKSTQHDQSSDVIDKGNEWLLSFNHS